jgi:hypothetical protein
MDSLYDENYVENATYILDNVGIQTRRRKEDGHESESYFGNITSKAQEDGTQTTRRSIFK